nr:alpha/beta fold hydrolase [Acinetobacter larvae]
MNKISQQIVQQLDHIAANEKPKLYFQPQGKLENTLDKLSQLQQKYRPTLWLSNRHAHLLYFDLIKKRRIRLSYDRIDHLTMQDGGMTAIVWLGKDLPAQTPTILILHTITGTPESMRELARDLHQYTGWRIALCLRRGHAGLPMPVAKINLFGSTADLREQLAYIQKRYPESDLYAMGSSAGTGLLVRYLGEEAEKTPLKAAFALCPGYNTELGFRNVHPLYSKVMTQKLFKKFIYPYRQTWQNTATLQRVTASKTLYEFEQAYYEMAGYPDYDSYNQATNPIYVLQNITTPLLVLNAEDDPICHIANFEPYKAVVENMPNIAVVTTPKGSHCGFYEGFWQTRSWASRLAADFFLIEAQKNQ